MQLLSSALLTIGQPYCREETDYRAAIIQIFVLIVITILKTRIRLSFDTECVIAAQSHHPSLQGHRFYF